MQIATGGAGGFALDSDPVVTGIGRSREGVVPKQRPRLALGLDSQREVLAGTCGGERRPVRVVEPDGDHGVALSLDSGHGQPAETGPGRRRAGRCQTGVAAPGFSFEQGAEGGLPARAEGRDPQRSEQLLTRVSGEVEQPVDLGGRHLFRARGELEDLVSRLDLALSEHAEVEAGPAMGDEQGGNARVVHANAHAVTGDARLRDFEDGGADLVAVADAHFVVAQSLDGEVLAELPVDEVASSELALPVPIGVDLVDEHGALLAAVPGGIALTVAVEVEPAHPARTGDGILEHAGEDGPPLPGHVLRQADVHGQQRSHPLRCRAHADAAAEVAVRRLEAAGAPPPALDRRLGRQRSRHRTRPGTSASSSVSPQATRLAAWPRATLADHAGAAAALVLARRAATGRLYSAGLNSMARRRRTSCESATASTSAPP